MLATRRVSAPWPLRAAAVLVALLCALLFAARAEAAPVFSTPTATPAISSVAVSGTVDAGGEPTPGDTSWYFEYRVSGDPGWTTSDVNGLVANGAAGATPVSGRISGLLAATTYEVRLTDGVTPGAAATFSTASISTPLALAQAMATDPSQITSAAWDVEAPTSAGIPYAVQNTPLGGLPVNGSTFSLMTSGQVDDARLPNTATNTGTILGPDPLAAPRGEAFDTSTLRVGLNVPAGASCLSVTFRFYSEEYPEFIGSNFSDGFLAELDTSDWTTSPGGGVSAPSNFASLPGGGPITINNAGPAAMDEAQAAGTTYDGATRLLRASTPVTPGAHTLYLSLYDQGDAKYDSAAIVDDLAIDSRTPCTPGVVDATPPVTPPDNGGTPQQAIAGQQAVASVVEGKVLVTTPDGRTFELKAGDAIPVGSTIDARAGRLRLAASEGTTQASGVFYGGVFAFTQSQGVVKTARATRGRAAATKRIWFTNLRLSEKVNFKSCPKAGKAGASAKRKRKRYLWGDGKGHFRTTGTSGAATVRGTKWYVEDNCKGTLVKVVRGVVDVRDFGKKKTVKVRAGKSYLAKRRR